MEGRTMSAMLTEHQSALNRIESELNTLERFSSDFLSEKASIKQEFDELRAKTTEEAWAGLSEEEIQDAGRRIIELQAKIGSLQATSGPSDPKHIMYDTPASNPMICGIFVFWIAAAAMLFISVVALWDESFGVRPRESVVLVTVMAMGALGGCLRLICSFVKYIGNRQLKRSWLTFYLAMPYEGAIIAMLIYMLLRVGIVSLPAGEGSETQSRILFSIYAFSGLSGLFARNAVDKLAEIFKIIFQTPADKDMSDPLGTAKPGQ